jgi:hypothetical protein
MWHPSWLRFSTPASKRARSSGRHLRPWLEILEDRCLLSAPALGYSSYLPSTAYAVAVDGAGEAFLAGGPAGINGGAAYVARMNSAGTALAYLTTLGSDGANCATGIALDSSGDAYVTGCTTSTNFPTTANAAYQASAAFPDGSVQAGFLTELSPTGSILYSTYLPGVVGLDYIATEGPAVALGRSGNVYVTGGANPGLPTVGAFQSTDPQGGPFLAVLNPTLSGLLYSSYLGGGAGTGVAVNASGDAYITGYTSSSTFPTTAGALQTSYTGKYDAFVAEFNPSLTGAASLVWSSYLGGSGTDGWISDNHSVIAAGQTGPAIAVDSAGNVYVTGSTSSANFPTKGAVQSQLGNPPGSGPTTIDSDTFVTKINPAGTALIYSTYLGGNNLDGGAGIAVDGYGDAYVTGWSRSTNFPTLNPIQAQKSSGNDIWNAPNSDVFVAALNSAGSGLLFSTYLGGIGDDYGFGIALDPSGNAYVAGQTIGPNNGSNNYPTTPGAYETMANAQFTGFVSQITPVAANGSLSVTGYPSPSTAGQAGTVTITALNADGTVNTGYAGTVHFTSSDPQAVLPVDYTFTAADQGVHTFSTTLKTAGTQSITAADTTGSVIGGEVGIVVNLAASLSITGLPSSVKAGTAYSFTVTAQDAYGNTATGYQGTIHFTSSDAKAKLPGNYTFTASDNGSHTFSNAVTFQMIGTQTLTATDTTTGTIKGTATVQVVKNLTSQTVTASSPRVGSAIANPNPPISATLISPLLAGSGTTTSTDADPSEPSSVVALWQQADALALQRLDAWLSMEAGAMGVTKHTLLHDFLFASRSSSSGV